MPFRFRDRRAVITGMGVVSPSGHDLGTFWDNVRLGRSAADYVTQFDTSRSLHKVAAEIRDFNCDRLLTSKNARRCDKAIKFGLVAARFAVRDAGLDLRRLDPDRLGIVEGTTLSGIESVHKAHVIYFQEGPQGLSPINTINGYCGEGSSIIALELGLKAHAITLCSGCCASNDAVGYALTMIQTDEADVIVAGGTDANLSPLVWGGFCSLRVMTKRLEDPRTAMRPFDRTRDGFVLSEGAGFLVIEELAHALQRRARIYAEVLGHGRSCEAYHVVDLHPEGAGVSRAIEKALHRACLDRTQIDYINAHGSATPTNDPIETKAIKRVFGAQARRLAISATKPVTGHPMGAAGAWETIICALSLHHQVIPPTINLREPAPDCDLDYVPLKARPYPLRTAMNLNSGFGGKNSCLILGQHSGARP